MCHIFLILGLETSNQGPKRQDSYQQAIGLNSKIYIVNTTRYKCRKNS